MKMMSKRPAAPLAVVLLSLTLLCAPGCGSNAGNNGFVAKDTLGGGTDAGAPVDSGVTEVDSISSDVSVGVDTESADAATADTTTVSDGASTTDAKVGGSDTGEADGARADTGEKTDTGAGADADGGGGQAKVNSCSGRCGDFTAAAACQCDSSCTSFKDCCSDFTKECACTVDKDCAKASDKCITLTCNTGGMCTKPTGSAASKCDDKNPCTKDSCDPKTGKCTNVTAKDTTVCTGGTCMKEMKCTAGKCGGGVAKADGNYCSDGNSCTTSDRCQSGSCAPGDTRVCNDKNTCTKDSCDPKKGCRYTPDLAAGAKCDDGKSCTADTKCTTSGSCTGTSLPSGSPCDDDNLCSSDDKCSSFGSCYGKYKNCNDDNPCTLDTCDKKTGACSNTVKKDKSYCSDGNSCTTGDTCEAGTCVSKQSKDGTTCSDGNSCTTKDVCTGGTCAGAASASKAGKSCTDSDPCTKSDKCDAAGTCIGEPNEALCDDGNSCTINACIKLSKYSKECKYTPFKDGESCDDGDACTGGSTCTKRVCSGGKALCKDVYTDAIDCKSSKWTYEPTVSTTEVGWNADATPGTPVAKSGTCSLNYNDGKSYDKKTAGKSVKNNGSATSAQITLSKGTESILTFWSYNGVESSTTYDLRNVVVSSDDFTASGDSQSWTLNNKKNRKAWEKVTYSLKAFSGKKIRIRFDFTTKDATSNTGTGWFIDDVKIREKTK